MTITALPTPPSSTDKTSFNSRADAFLAALVNFVTETNATADELNALVAALNFNSTNSTSTSSLTIDSGNKSLTVETNKSYVAGMTLQLADTADVTKWMQGEVTAYDAGTGALAVNVTHTSGSGTLTAWTISLASRMNNYLAGADKVVVHAGNGFGSINTKIRRFTTIRTNVGSAITYADSGSLGATFTINNSGIYSINYSDSDANNGQLFGVSINSNQLSTGFDLIADSSKLFYSGGFGGIVGGSGIVTYLNAGDVLRCHASGALTGAYSHVRMIIERLF